MSAPVHPPRPILDVAEEVLEQVRLDERLSDALDHAAPGHDNVRVSWLSKLGCYEVVLRFDAAMLGTAVRGVSGAPPGSVA